MTQYSGRRPILLGGIFTVSIWCVLWIQIYEKAKLPWSLLLIGVISFRGDTHPAAA